MAISFHSEGLCYFCLFALVLYSVTDAFLTRRLIRKSADNLPFVGSPWVLTPRFILNLIFATGAAGILEHGYKKFKNRAFQLVRSGGRVVILPLSVLDELATVPTTVASPHGALEHDLLGPYTGLNIILENRLHHSIVQRKLTPRLPILTPRLETELTSAFNEDPALTAAASALEWTEFRPYDFFARISARLSAQAIVTPDFAHNPSWLDISVNYTENLFRTIVILRLFPSWMHSLLCYLLPSFWRCQRYIRSAKELLGPRIRDMLNANDDGSWTPQDNSDQDMNVLSWLVDNVKGKDRKPDTIAHVEVLLALASVHTTLLRLVNVLYDLTCSNPETAISAELEAEIESVASLSPAGWTASSYDKLYKMDSVIRESQRMSPPTTMGMKRLFRRSYTFQNGIHVSKGEYVAMPIYAIENDPAHTLAPEKYDGLRTYRLLSQKMGEIKLQNPNPDGENLTAVKEFLFASPTQTSLNFGYGKHVCPGRFFASLIIKMVFVKLVTEYEFQFLPGEGAQRPPNLMVHEFLFTWPWRRMLIRRKPGGLCPF